MDQNNVPERDMPDESAALVDGAEVGEEVLAHSRECLVLDWSPNRQRFQSVVAEVEAIGWGVVEIEESAGELPPGKRPAVALVHKTDTNTRAWATSLKPAIADAGTPLVVLHTWGGPEPCEQWAYAEGCVGLLASSEAVLRNLGAILKRMEEWRLAIDLSEAQRILDIPPTQIETTAGLAILCQGFLAAHRVAKDYLDGWEEEMGDYIPTQARSKTEAAAYWACLGDDNATLEEVIRLEAGESSLHADVAKLIRALPLGKDAVSPSLSVEVVGKGFRALSGVLAKRTRP